MSSATIYVLLSNDGEEDLLLTADMMLHKRLAEIRDINMRSQAQQRAQTGRISKESPTAKIADITTTHLLWIHRRFHPYVAMCHTFYATQVYSGTATLPAGGSYQFDMEYAGEFYNKACVHVTFSSGTIGLDAGDAQYFAWSPMLGHKWIQDVEFRVNTSQLDKYDNHFMQSYYEFNVDEDSKPGYLRCIGQQVPEVARVEQFESAITATGGVLGTVGYEEEVTVTNGPQTRKVTHDAIEMFIPLKFWWNYQSEESFCTLTVPNGQRIIKLNLEKLENLVQMYDKDGTPIAYNVSKFTTRPEISNIELLVQNIYVNPDINDVYIDRIGFHLVRLHRYQDIVINSSSFNERLSLLKWPTEEIRIAIMPRENLTGTRIEDGFTYGVVSPQTLNMAGRWHGNPTTAITTQLTATHRRVYDILSTLTLTVQGMKLYDAFSAKFFKDFVPTKFSEERGRKVPRGNGWYMINFTAKPGNPQCAGHINISRSRETFLQGTTIHVGTGAASPAVDEAIMHVEGISLNFTFTSNGNIIIRFIG